MESLNEIDDRTHLKLVYRRKKKGRTFDESSSSSVLSRTENEDGTIGILLL